MPAPGEAALHDASVVGRADRMHTSTVDRHPPGGRQPSCLARPEPLAGAGLLLLFVGLGCGDPVEPSERADTGPGIVSVGATGDSTGLALSDGTTDDQFVLDVSPSLDLFAGDSSGDQECDSLVATIRDFSLSHPDFEAYAGDFASLGLVRPQLGDDDKPQHNPAYAGPVMITSAESFAQWYRDVPGTNSTHAIDLPLEEIDGEFSFDSTMFFPVDGQGLGNEGNPNNFHFTTEVHTSFTYQGGEVFTFRGDDDLWLFVDGRLALDLGGLHPALEGTVDMDTLGLELGETYPMDIFHAERHTTASNFRIVTTIECFVSPPPPA